LLTPHIGWQVREVFHEFVEIAARQLEAWLNSDLPQEEVLNPEAFDIERLRIGGLKPNHRPS
jgi:phosphoglycerate dehydrogenase-like enzyme